MRAIDFVLSVEVARVFHHLAWDWQKSAQNPYKAKTHKQFLADCVASLGIKRKGSLGERIKQALLTRPDLYTKNARTRATE
jgi:hypothetical protein